MKKFNFIVLSIFIASCSTDSEKEIIKNDINSKKYQDINLKEISELKNTPIYSNNELIIQFEDNVTNTQKQSIRSEQGIISYEVCNCTDDSIEKWTFGNGIDIEVKKNSVREEEGGVEGFVKNVDTEFSFNKEYISYNSVPILNIIDYQTRVTAQNEGVTIAVLDTGLDVNYPRFKGKYLFNAQNYQNGTNVGIPNQFSGWDYVNEDDNTNDDYSAIHGTKVAFIIHERLETDNIPHQILPIKVADEHGKVSAFNLICGAKNAIELSDIVNMSLGYYSNGESDKSTIMEDIIIENPDVLFVTSAGNNSTNNDDLYHYPSSYYQNNVLAIAAANTDGSGKADFSNYGLESVDFFAVGENILFIDANGGADYISGTSFAAPYAAAISAKLLHDSQMTISPAEIIETLNNISNTIYDDQDKIKYGKLILD